MLNNWLKQAADPIGSLPDGVEPVEWAVRNFIASWRKPVRNALDCIETSLKKASTALQRGDTEEARHEIDVALQTLGEDLRDDLGMYEWNRDDT